MLRSVTLGLVLSVLAAACAVIEPPVPAARAVQVEVRNLSDAPVGELGVKVRGGMLLYGAQPASVPAGSTTTVTFNVPIEGEWWVALNGIGVVEGRDFQGLPRIEACLIEFSANMAARNTCEREGPS